MMRIAVVEDEVEQADLLASYALRYSEEHDFPLRVLHYPNALNFLDEYNGDFDVVFMDIRLPMLDGMEAARRLRQFDEQVALVFVTSMAQYAINGYEVGALDFVLKPLDYDAFSFKMDRIRRYCLQNAPASYLLNSHGNTRVLKVSDIAFVEVYNHSLFFHLGGEAIDTHGQLSALEVDPRFHAFVKSSPSHLVNCNYITSIGPDYLKVGEYTVPLSRRRRKECLEKIARIIGGGGSSA